MRYVFDTSVWITVARHYPEDIFGELWGQLRAAIASGHVLSPEEVLHELRKGTDGLADTLAAEEGLFAPLDDDLQLAVGIVMENYPSLADVDAERNRADPFVVATGLCHSANGGGTVVSGERHRKNDASRHKIPDACDGLGVPCTDWFGFLRTMRSGGWKL